MAQDINSEQTYFQELPVAAVVMSQLLFKRPAHQNQPAKAGFGRVVSRGFTAVLIAVSLFGIFQLSSIFLSSIQQPSFGPAASQSTPAATAQPLSDKSTGGIGRSIPTRLQIPAINLDASIVSVGQNSDGSMEVPPAEVTGWYSYSPTPGELGPSIITGHVDDAVIGAAVFYNLDKLQKGDRMSILRQDGSKVNFVVEKSEVYDQNNFPTEAVYGNIDYPGLRLITCDGDFNYLTRHYSHNLVVYAKAEI